MLDSVKHTVRFYVYIHFLSTVQHRSITVPVSSTAGIVPRPTVPTIKYPLSISKPSVIVRDGRIQSIHAKVTDDQDRTGDGCEQDRKT